MRNHSAFYQNFLSQEVDLTVAAYCLAKIERPGIDIEEPGIHALWNAVIKEMGVAIKIVNLDSTPGDECQIISYLPLDSEGPPSQNTRTIWMLRRLMWVLKHIASVQI